MKYIKLVFLPALLTACDGEDILNDNPNFDSNIIQINILASDLSGPVTILDRASEKTFIIENNGENTIDVAVSEDQNYKLKLINSEDSCSLIMAPSGESHAYLLNCGYTTACIAQYDPFCGKRINFDALPEVEFSLETIDRCVASTANYADFIFDGVCGDDNEGKVVDNAHEPVSIAPHAVILVDHHPLISYEGSIDGDVVRVDYQASGGCGYHDVGLIVDEMFTQSNDLELNVMVRHISYDNCEAIISESQYFDLLPVKHHFIQSFPDASGEQRVLLNGLGEYVFNI